MNKSNYYALTFTGRRKSNQDACLAIQEGNLLFLGVADGMGGAKGGEIASAAVIEVCKLNLLEAAATNPLPGDLKGIMEKIFSDCRERLEKIIAGKPELTGMGTTLSCVLMLKDHYVWGNIGDSRVYHFDGTVMKQITVDHSFIEAYRKDYGNDIPEYIKARSNVITRSLGGDKDEPDIFPEDKDFEILKPGDGFLICSDGLIPDKVSADTEWMTHYLLGTKTLKEAAENLVCYAFFAGSSDNITVVLYENGKFRRKKTSIKKFKYPPVEKVIHSQTGTRHIRYRRLLIIFLLILLIGAGYLLMKYFHFQEPADKEIPLTEMREADTEEPPQIHPDWDPWKREDFTGGKRISEEMLSWEDYPDREQVKKYVIKLTPSGGSVPVTIDNIGKSPNIHLNSYKIKPGNYDIEITAILKDGRKISRSEKNIKLN